MSNIKFDGDDYIHGRDKARLTGQLHKIYFYILNGKWVTLKQIAEATGAPEASISAQLRNLRKERFGGHTIEKEFVKNGIYRYRFVQKEPA